MKEERERVKTRIDPLSIVKDRLSKSSALKMPQLSSIDAADFVSKFKSCQKVDEKLLSLVSLSEYIKCDNDFLDRVLQEGLITCLFDTLNHAISHGTTSQQDDLVVELMRSLALISNRKLECLKQLVNVNLVDVLMKITFSKPHIIGPSCELLCVLCSQSEKSANEVGKQSDFMSTLFETMLSSDNENNQVTFACAQLVFVLMESGAPALERFISVKKAELISDHLVTLDPTSTLAMEQSEDGGGSDNCSKLLCALFLIGILFSGMSRNLKAEFKIANGTILVILAKALKQFSNDSALGFVLDLMSLSTVLMDNSEELIIEDDEMEMEEDADHEVQEDIAEAAAEEEMGKDVSEEEVELMMEGVTGHMDSSYLHWLKSHSIWQQLCEIVLAPNNSTQLQKVKAMNAMGDILLNANASFVDAIGGKQSLFQFIEGIWTLLFEVYDATTDDLVSKVFLFTAISDLLWSLGRFTVETLNSCFESTVISITRLISVFNSCKQVSSNDNAFIPKILIDSTMLNIVGILDTLVCPQRALDQQVQEIKQLCKFLMEVIECSDFKYSAYIVAECINVLIDLFAADERNAAYQSIPGLTAHLRNSIVPLVKQKSKKIDPRKPVYSKVVQQNVIDEWKMCVLDRLLVYREGRFARDRTWDMYVNLNRFVDYKLECERSVKAAGR